MKKSKIISNSPIPSVKSPIDTIDPILGDEDEDEDVEELPGISLNLDTTTTSFFPPFAPPSGCTKKIHWNQGPAKVSQRKELQRDEKA